MRASGQLVVLVVRSERARLRRCGDGCQVDLGTFEAHRSIADRVSSRVTSRHERPSSCVTLVGVAPRVYCPPSPHEMTREGMRIHIKVVVARQPDGKQFADHLRSSIPSGVVSVGV